MRSSSTKVSFNYVRTPMKPLKPQSRSVNIVTESLTRSDIVKSDGVHATPYTAEHVIRLPVIGSWRVVETSDKGVTTVDTNHTGYLADVSPPNLNDWKGVSDLRGQSALKAFTSLKGQQVNIGMMLAESKSSKKLVASMLRSIINGTLAIVRKDAKGFVKALGIQGAVNKKKVTRQMASNHLALIFGLSPIISDIQGIIAEMTDGKRAEKFIKVHGNSKVSDTDEGTYLAFPAYTSGASYIKPEWQRTDSFSASCRCHLTYRLDNAKLHALARNGVLNAPHLVWDYIPLSFVVDFGLTVGKWLNANDAQVGFEFVTGCFSEIRESSRALSLVGFPGEIPADRRTKLSGNGAGFARRRQFRRVPLTAPPVSRMYFKNPFSLFSVSASASLIAVLTNVLKDAPKGRVPKTFSYRGKRVRYLPPIEFT